MEPSDPSNEIANPVQARQILAYADPSTKNQSKRGRGFVAVCAALPVLGLGHATCGRLSRGIVWFLGSLLLTASTFFVIAVPKFFPAILLLFPIGAIWNLSGLIDSYLCGHRNTRDLFGGPIHRYLVGCLFLIVLVAGGRFTNPSLAAALYFRDHSAEAFVLTTNSIAPTLIPMDRFLCIKGKIPPRWGVAVVKSPATPNVPIVKRIVGLPGESVQIVDGQVSINGVLLNSPAGIPAYVTTRPGGIPIGGPGCDSAILLGPDEFYCLGDKSPISGDSRHWPAVGQHQRGALPGCSIVGTVTYIYWPPKRWRRIYTN